MSDQGDETESTVSRDDITVYQTYRDEASGVPTVVLKMVSDRDGPADVHVAVDLPPDMHTADVGFHPDYRRDGWSIEDDRLEFTGEIGPGEEVTTMYAIESQADVPVGSLLESLAIERVAAGTAGTTADPSGAGSASTPQPEPQPQSDGPADDREDVSGDSETETETENETESETETEGLIDALGPSEIVEAEDVDGGSDADETGTRERPASSGYSTAELVAELEQCVQDGRLTDEDRDRMYALLEDGSGDAAVGDDLRVAHLQQRVSDLEASIESIADLDDRHGSPAEAFAALEERVAGVDEEASATTERIGEVESRLDGIEDGIRSLAEQQAELESEVTDLTEWREQVRSIINALGDS